MLEHADHVASRSIRAAAALALLLLTAAPARGQHQTPDAATHFALGSANALVAAVSAGTVAWLRGEGFSRAFGWGAAGGSAAYAGKAVATARFSGAPFVGRQVAAVGHSVIGNAAAGRGPLAELWLPVTPLRVRLPLAGARWGVQLDLLDTGLLLYATLTPELTFDSRLTARTGAPVFVARGWDMFAADRDVHGVAAGSVILLSGDVGPDERGATVAHEMVHVIQSDFMKVAWSYPVEDWLRSMLTGPARRGSVLQGGFAATAVQVLLGAGEGYGLLGDLREREADALVRRVRAPTRQVPQPR